MKNVLVTLSVVFVFAFTFVSDKDYRLPYQEQDYIKIKSGFGYSNKSYPVQGIIRKFNNGVVFQLEQDAEIYSVQDGLVVIVRLDDSIINPLSLLPKIENRN